MSTLLVIAALAYLGLCTYMFVIQRSLIYFPQPGSPGTGTSTMTLSTDGAQVLVTTRPHGGPHALLYFGGNAEDVNHSLPGLASAFPDHAIYLLHYRGYGGSTGKPTEAALVADALTLFDKVHAEHPDIVLVGRSLGTGVAVQLASQRRIARLVLVTPYDSLLELASNQFPYLPVSWLLLDKFESGKYAAQVTAPTLVIAAEQDEVIPRKSTETLYGRFPTGIASFRVIANAGHNTISESSQYIPLLRGSP